MTDARELVKPLEWRAGDDPDCMTAGDYEIWHEGHGYQLYFWSIVQGEPFALHCEAEGLAWQLHRARILSALNPAFLERVERLEAAAKAVLDNADRPGSRRCLDGGPDGEDIWIDHQEVDQSVLDELKSALSGEQSNAE